MYGDQEPNALDGFLEEAFEDRQFYMERDEPDEEPENDGQCPDCFGYHEDLNSCEDVKQWDHRDRMEEHRRASEKEYANRWLAAWERLERLGVVSSPEDDGLTLKDLERISSYLGSQS